MLATIIAVILASGEVSDWAALRKACESSGTVNLSDDFAMGKYDKAIDFSGKALVIMGNHKTLDANQHGNLFAGDAHHGDTSLELHDVVISNGKTNHHGGAIYITGHDDHSAKLTVHSSTFTSNHAGQGGAISAVKGAKVALVTCSFTTNKADQGGAVYVSDDPTTVTIRGTSFDHNTVGNKDKGGALYLDQGASGTLHGCTFKTDNSDSDVGGNGDNDVGRNKKDTELTFECADGHSGDPVTMSQLSLQSLPPKALKCSSPCE